VRADECIGSMPVVPSLDPEWSANFVPPQLAAHPGGDGLHPDQTCLLCANGPGAHRAEDARDMSPCASYYVSIPPIAADKTRPRGPLQRA
jgi:hypothetical protein